MTPTDRPETDSAEDRLARLIDRLLIAAEAAASSGAWDRVSTIAGDILAVSPDNPQATAMLERARVEQSLPDGQRAFVSLVFSDIVRSTDMAEFMEPETVRDLFRIYRQAASESIDGLGGKVLQFQGDGIFACFGYPNVYEDDAKRAVLAGLGLVERMAAAAPEVFRRHGIDASIRVGIHTGTVVVAGLNSNGSDLDIVGVTANLAARLQAEAESNSVVISAATKQLVDTDFELASLGMRTLKGISRPLEVFRVLRARRAGPLEAGRRFQTASLIGRDRPRELLQDCWNEVMKTAGTDQRPERGLVVLRGQAGIGKSRLAADLCEQVQSDGGSILQSSCSPYHTNVALWPVARMLEHRLGLYPHQPPEERLAEVERRLEARGFEKSEVIPLLAPLLGLDIEKVWARPELDPVALRAEALNALAQWLARFARTTPTLLLVEDFHWADPTTVELLGTLAAETSPGVMILMTCREPVGMPWAEEAVDVELTPMRPEEAAGLVAALLPSADPDRLRMIIERGGGIPLFIQELARSATSATPGETVPPRLQELLAARLRAPGIDLRIAQYAATLGSVFEEAVLRELAGGPVIDALAQLQAAGIIEPSGDAGRGSYRFRHVLLRDAAYETQVLDARQATHRNIARLLRVGASTPGDLAVLAQHHDLAGEVADAIPAYVTAGRAAQAEASHTEARRLLDRALELLMTTPETDERDLTELTIRMLRSMSVSSLFGYGYPEVFEDFQLADRICHRHRNRPEIVPAQVGIWSYMLTRGELEAAKETILPLAASAGSPELTWFAPEIKSCMGYTAFYGGDLNSARRWLEDAWDDYLSRPSDDAVSPFWPLPNDPVPVTAVALACVAALQGRTAESKKWEERALASAEDIGFPRGPFTLAFVLVYMAWSRAITGDTAGARTLGLRIVEIADQHRFTYFRMIAGQYVLVPDRDNPVDVSELEQCETAMDLVGHGAFRPAYLGLVARNHAYLGNATKAIDSVNKALLRLGQGELVHQPELLRIRAEIVADAYPQRADDAVADLLSAIEIASSQGSLLHALRASTSLARLPQETRPKNWRNLLRRAVDRFPPDSESPDLADAISILDA